MNHYMTNKLKSYFDITNFALVVRQSGIEPTLVVKMRQIFTRILRLLLKNEFNAKFVIEYTSI